tara:strand:- start:311 stop:499 length:189 start_codon:yes stop_codon:yes gene_type:complete
MIVGSPTAIEFYIKSAWARGKSTSEIIKKVYDTFGKTDEVNKITLSCIALLHASTVYRQEEY